MHGLGGRSKVLAIVASFILAIVLSFQFGSRFATPGAGVSSAAAGSAVAPQAEPPSNEIKDFQQLD
jgi:hypothetical protein